MDITLNRPDMQTAASMHERVRAMPGPAAGQPEKTTTTTVGLPAATEASGPEPAARQTDTPDTAAAHDEVQLEEAVDSMQNSVREMQRNLSFAIDESSGRTVVEVRDASSGEVIRQLPSEQALKLAESLDEMRSLLFKAEA